MEVFTSQYPDVIITQLGNGNRMVTLLGDGNGMIRSHLTLKLSSIGLGQQNDKQGPADQGCFTETKRLISLKETAQQLILSFGSFHSPCIPAIFEITRMKQQINVYRVH